MYLFICLIIKSFHKLACINNNAACRLRTCDNGIVIWPQKRFLTMTMERTRTDREPQVYDTHQPTHKFCNRAPSEHSHHLESEIKIFRGDQIRKRGFMFMVMFLSFSIATSWSGCYTHPCVSAAFNSFHAWDWDKIIFKCRKYFFLRLTLTWRKNLMIHCTAYSNGKFIGIFEVKENVELTQTSLHRDLMLYGFI